MSGIYGIFQANSICNDVTKSLSCMKKWNSAYGANVIETKISPKCALGIAHEHITVSPRTASPVLFQDNITAVVDCIIYNREELLSKYNLSPSLSDEEIIFSIILRSANISKPDLSDVNGDFCGAAYNSATRTLALFRDHLGVRPLFYYTSDSMIAFSTDIRGLIAIPESNIDVNPDWVYKTVCGYTNLYYTDTEISNVFEVAPASVITFSPNSNELIEKTDFTYWRLGRKKIRYFSRKTYAEKLNQIIRDSVNKRLAVFPDKIGAELSGGLDSGVISMLISRANREGVFFSWSFSPDELPIVPNDERLIIKDICDQENINVIYASDVDLSADSPIGKKHIDAGLSSEFSYDSHISLALPSYINTFVVCASSTTIYGNGGHVVFSGHGGDEGVSHRSNIFELMYNHEYFHALVTLWIMSEGHEHRIKDVLRIFKRHFINTLRPLKPFDEGTGTPELISNSLAISMENVSISPLYFTIDPIKYIYSGCTKNRPCVTALLGAYSNARYIFPYLDYRAIDYSVSIPRYLYLKGNQNRAVFREAFKDLMPQSLYNVTVKENPSEASFYDTQPDSDWYSRYTIYLNDLSANLDRSFWSRYLNFDVIDKWISSGEPSKDNRSHFLEIGSKLLQCYRFQKMVQSVKEASQKTLNEI